MFELLRAYEPAVTEKNKFLRAIYTVYVRHKLKSIFFKKFKASIGHIELDKRLIREFQQFFICTNLREYESDIHVEFITTSGVSDNDTIKLRYFEYNIIISCLENGCDITIYYFEETNNKHNTKAVSLHPGNEFYTSFFAEIILMAIYNYCVAYIYGKNSKLFIDDNSYVEKIKMYF